MPDLVKNIINEIDPDIMGCFLCGTMMDIRNRETNPPNLCDECLEEIAGKNYKGETINMHVTTKNDLERRI